MNYTNIKKITLGVSKSLQNRQNVADGLCFLDNFLSQEYLDKILEFAQTTDKWEPYKVAHQQNRFIILGQEWDFLNILQQACIQITPQLKNIFKKPELYFGGITLWQDRHKYYIAKHTDNPEIEVAIQIYLSDNSIPLPTVFVVGDQDIAANYKINAGYLIDNSKEIVHYLWPPIPQGEIRTSLHLTWKATKTING
jgi:hypothetical protein